MNIALRLDAGECGADYAEAVMVLCASISALAAEVWPGKHKDRARFVQVIVEFSNAAPDATRLSIPLLIGNLRQSSCNDEATVLESNFLRFDPSHLLAGEEVDRTENEVLSLCPNLSTKFLRQFSYANLLYEEVRSAYVHQYAPGERADSWSMTSRTHASISYGNWMNDPNRHIHFHVEWVARVVKSVAKSIDLSSSSFPRPDQEAWWINGQHPTP